ncbi:MAG: FimB/Mfa2 family fimbrial subunit [Bacteroides sp.]|nr:FimB/Mfa2 family fimbrial subunit [Bacteroides sp.]
MKRLLLTSPLWLLLLLTACVNSISDESEEELSLPTLEVITRSTTDIPYPLTVYAFRTETGELMVRQAVNEGETSATLNLPAGSYHLVALAGSGECQTAQQPTLEDVITFPANNRLSQALMMGSADLNISGDATANITMYHQVAAIDLTLQEMPSTVSSVSVSLSTLCNQLSFNGALQGSVTTTVTCSREDDGTWKAARFYVLPGSGKQLVLSIATKSGEETLTYGYTHAKSLEANTPYQLTGSYHKGFTINGNVTAEGWNETQYISFTFGTGIENDPTDDTTNTSPTIGELPSACSVWQGHFVATVTPNSDGSQAEVLLLSLQEWQNAPSEYNTSGYAKSLVNSYSEDDYAGWEIPTKEEAKAIREVCGNSNLSTTNALLQSIGATPLSDGGKDSNGNTIRYLCEDATATFTWDTATSNSISKAGSKRSYYLRGVKRITVKAAE